MKGKLNELTITVGFLNAAGNARIRPSLFAWFVAAK